ncbi:MAG: hypothetical protein HY689_06995 [Chloroflexi bacterium]|nr:hypothetical protein [Chloroflexota bacterium]
MAEQPYTVRFLNPDEARQFQQRDPKTLLVDIRSRATYDRSHIRGAISLPVAEVEAHWGVARGRPHVVVYGEMAEDPDAAWAARVLARRGITGVVVLEGGYRAWEEAGFPLESAMHPTRPPGRELRPVSFPTLLRRTRHGQPVEAHPGHAAERPVGVSPSGPRGRILSCEECDYAETVVDESAAIRQFLAHAEMAHLRGYTVEEVRALIQQPE